MPQFAYLVSIGDPGCGDHEGISIGNPAKQRSTNNPSTIRLLEETSMKKKLALQDLKIKSFVTLDQKENREVRAGAYTEGIICTFFVFCSAVDMCGPPPV